MSSLGALDLNVLDKLRNVWSAEQIKSVLLEELGGFCLSTYGPKLLGADHMHDCKRREAFGSSNMTI